MESHAAGMFARTESCAGVWGVPSQRFRISEKDILKHCWPGLSERSDNLWKACHKIYAHADTEHKRRAITASTPQNNPLYSKLNSARYTVDDEEMLKRLVGLR